MVDETDIANVHAGNPVSFTVDSFSSRDFPGAVASIAPKATIVSGVVNYEVVINIKKDAQLLKPDMTANVSIQTAQHEALVLPAVAVQRDGEQSFVYIPRKAGTERKPVAVGNKDGQMVEIKRGISPGDEILLPASSESNMQAKPAS
jgi:multidrug efflux pump subunit AcrA (membrane-fusion protein)